MVQLQISLRRRRRTYGTSFVSSPLFCLKEKVRSGVCPVPHHPLDVCICQTEKLFQDPPRPPGRHDLLSPGIMGCSQTVVVSTVIWQLAQDTTRCPINEDAFVPLQIGMFSISPPKCSSVCICQLLLTLRAVEQAFH